MSNTIFALWIGLAAVLLLLFLYAGFLNLRRRQSSQVELGEIDSFLPACGYGNFVRTDRSGEANAICKRPTAEMNCGESSVSRSS